MTTELKIKEAFEKQYRGWSEWNPSALQSAFTAGYMALLNELEPASVAPMKNNPRFVETTYRLPEGVTKS